MKCTKTDCRFFFNEDNCWKSYPHFNRSHDELFKNGKCEHYQKDENRLPPVPTLGKRLREAWNNFKNSPCNNTGIY